MASAPKLPGHREPYLSMLLCPPAQSLAYLGTDSEALPLGGPVLLSSGNTSFCGETFFHPIEELVERHFERPRKLLQRFKCRHRMSVFDARNIATQKTGTLLDVPLRKILALRQFSEPTSEIHAHLPIVHRCDTTFIGYP